MQKTGDGEYVAARVGVYNQLAATVWTWYGDGILYPDGTTTPPPDMITRSKDCAYYDEDVRTFYDGIILSYVI
jgi:hypothetical protein